MSKGPATSVDRGPGRLIGLVAVVTVALWPVVEAVRVVIQSGQRVTYLDGDQAVMELASRRAWHLDQTVGPWSRFGWHHPGPAMFYLLALPVRLLEAGGSGVYLGTVVVNGVAALAIVVWVLRRHGARAALVTALAVDALCLSLSLPLVTYPWNPYLVILPCLLFAVLWPSAARGHLGALVWAAVVGSYCLQTHISTALFVLVMLAAAVVLLLRRSTRRSLTFSKGFWAGIVALVLIWMPSVVELFTDHPNNLTLLYRFTKSQQQYPSLRMALHSSLNAMVMLPFGFHTTPASTLVMSDGHLVLGLAGVAVLGVAAFVVARRRGERTASYLLAATAATVVLGVLSTTRSAGGILVYLVAWQSIVPALAIIAFGVAWLAPADPAASGHRVPWAALSAGVPLAGATAICLGCCVWLTTLTTINAIQLAPTWKDSPSDATVLEAALRAVLTPADRVVNVDILSPALSASAATVLLDAVRMGKQTTVTPASFLVEFGNERRADKVPSVVFDIYDATDSAAVAQARGLVAAVYHNEILTWYRPAAAG